MNALPPGRMPELAPLLAAVEARQDELVALLCKLVAFETPAPPARNTSAAQDYIETFLRGLGASIDRWDVHPGDPNVVGVLAGSAPAAHKSLIINGHVDVAAVAPDEPWETAPFTPIIRDGVVIGRGVADMKGGLAGALFALRLLHEHGVKLPGDVIFQSVIGEEVGEAGTLQCCKRGYTADVAVVVDTSELHIQGQGGVITGWITVKSPQTYHDGTRRRMVHAGGGLFAASAIEKMAKIVQGLGELERHWAVTKRYPGCPAGANTINPAVIEGGRHAAFIADECRLWITVHYYPNESHEQIIREIEEHVAGVAAGDPWLKAHPPSFVWGGSSMIIDRGEIFPSLEVDPEHPATKLMEAMHEQVTAREAVIDISPTVTDGGWLGNAGIPAFIYGPGELRQAHSVNEQASIAELVTFTKVLLAFTLKWSHTAR